MRQTKARYSSKTVWSAAAGTVVTGGLGRLKIAADAARAADFANWAVAAATVASGAVGLYGRLTATRRSGPTSDGGTDAGTDGTNVTRLVWLCLGLATALGPVGCAADPAFVRAERATYDAVSPEYLAYVAADPALAADQKARRGRTIRTWDLSLRQHEQADGAAPAQLQTPLGGQP